MKIICNDRAGILKSQKPYFQHSSTMRIVGSGYDLEAEGNGCCISLTSTLLARDRKLQLVKCLSSLLQLTFALTSRSCPYHICSLQCLRGLVHQGSRSS